MATRKLLQLTSVLRLDLADTDRTVARPRAVPAGRWLPGRTLWGPGCPPSVPSPQPSTCPRRCRAPSEPIEADLAARLAEARAALGEEEFGREWELGRTLPVGSVRAKIDALAAHQPPPGG